MEPPDAMDTSLGGGGGGGGVSFTSLLHYLGVFIMHIGQDFVFNIANLYHVIC